MQFVYLDPTLAARCAGACAAHRAEGSSALPHGAAGERTSLHHRLRCVPDSRRHRSAAPEDREDFDPAAIACMREAGADLAWLAARGYPETASIALVGNRFQASARQRHALARAACADPLARERRARRVEAGGLADVELAIDGFNVLTTVEVALGGGVVLLGCDGCARDVAGVHGSWRKVEESRTAIARIGEHLAAARVRSAEWILDAPVSNSGRLKTLLGEIAAERGWPFRVRVEREADRALVESGLLVASSDRVVLDRVPRWHSLAREVVLGLCEAWIVNLDVLADAVP